MLLTNSPSVQRVPIDALKLSATPVRRHPKKEIEKARRLLAAHGQVPPVLAAPNGEIIFWEAIWLALKADGATELDAIIVTGKSPTELKALQLALNRIPLDASWDDQNVRNILEELVRVDFDLDRF
jgi:ParB-like chromosome segregation protein Spo0J